MGGKSQTIGYKYYFSLHMGLGRGPFNEIAEIQVGGVTAMDEPICIAEEGQLVYIDKPNLFGGEEKEGGIQGPMFVYNGARDQELQPALTPGGMGGGIPGWDTLLTKTPSTLPAIATMLGGDVPNFRGVVTIWFDGMVCAMNPYPKEWSFRVRRTTAGWYNNDPWYKRTCTISLMSPAGKVIRAMNGAHILYEVNTNPEWGRGMPAELLDENSYARAADQLCAEGFGLCIPWFRQESLKEFIPVIIDHIGGVQYVDRETGKLTLRLIRNDYVAADLPVFGPDTGLLDVIDDDSSSEDTAYNEIIVQGYDPTTREDIQVRVQSLGSIQNQGEIISTTRQFKGLATRDLCARVAQRELKAQLPLRRLTLYMDRRAWRLAPGMPFKINFPKRGIANMIVRAGQIDEGTLTNGRMTMKVVQDIFGMPSTSFVTPPAPIWTPPSFTPLPPPESKFMEANYRDYYRRVDPAERDSIDAGSSYVMMAAKKPLGVQTQGYDLFTRVPPADFTEATSVTGGFTAWLTLDGALAPLDTVLTVTEVNRAAFMVEYADGMVAQIDDEQISIETFDVDTGIATVKRGVADTIPQAHMAGSTLWLVDDETVSDGIEYQDGETVEGIALTRTSTEVLQPDLGTTHELEVNQRVYRPYPPGDVQQDGISVYSSRPATAEPSFTWVHRNRVMQGDHAVGHEEASVTPETGTTYTVRVYADDGTTLLNTYLLIAGETWTYDAAMQLADVATNFVYMELESARDGLASHFHYRFRVVLTGGYGYGYGLNYGGL